MMGGLLYQLEEHFENTVHDQLQKSLQEALYEYRPTCESCKVMMHSHHSYPRSILTRHGELSIQIPVFRCPECKSMLSGSDLIGEEDMRKRFSKKRGKKQ